MKKGFTILELLVVISVLVILIGIAIPRFKGMQDAGRIAQVKGELRTMQTAIESYYMNASPNAYPSSSTTLGGATLIGATPRILSSALYDPFGASTTTEYVYVANSPYYVVYSVGVNANGTADVTTAGVISKSNNALCISNAPNGGSTSNSCP